MACARCFCAEISGGWKIFVMVVNNCAARGFIEIQLKNKKLNNFFLLIFIQLGNGFFIFI